MPPCRLSKYDVLAPMILIPMRLCDWGSDLRYRDAFGVGPDGVAKFIRMQGKMEEDVTHYYDSYPSHLPNNAVEYCFEYMCDDGFLIVTDNANAKSVADLNLTQEQEHEVMDNSLYTRNGGYFAVVEGKSWIPATMSHPELDDSTIKLLRVAGIKEQPTFQWVIRYGKINEGTMVTDIVDIDASHPEASKYLRNGQLPSESCLKTNNVIRLSR